MAVTETGGWAWRGLAVAAIVAVGLGILWVFPVATMTVTALEWFQTAGPLGWLGFGLLYVLVTLFLLPTSVLTVGGGFIYGPFTGFLVVWISENVAALITFMVGRFLARPTVHRMVEKRPLLKALDGAMEDRGFSLLVLLRHSPIIPFSILNYTMSVTGISAGRYVAATLLGTALPAFLYVYVGSSLIKLNDVMSGEAGSSPAEQAIYWGGLVATVVATVVVTRTTRRALNRRLEQAGVDL